MTKKRPAREKEDRKCIKCWKIFTIEKSRKQEKDYYCSVYCWCPDIPTIINLKCEMCGKDYNISRSLYKWRWSNTCSKKCSAQFKRKDILNPRTLDGLWSDCIKLKFNHKCAICESSDKLNSHHLISRTNYSTRWDLDNWICLCAKHHMLSSKLSAHKTMFEFVDWWLKKFWQKEYEKLLLKSHLPYVKDYNKTAKYLYEFKDYYQKTQVN